MITGSRGDNQPFVPLAQELKRKGHTVQYWAVGANTTEWLKTFGIDALAQPELPDAETLLSENPPIKEAMAKGDIPTLLKLVAVILKPIEVPALDGLLGLHDAFKPNLIVYNNLKMGTARALYDLRGTTVCFGQLFPRSITATEAPVYLSLTGINLPCGCNRLLHALILGKLHASALSKDGAIQKRYAAAGKPPMTVHDLEDSTSGRCAAGARRSFRGTPISPWGRWSASGSWTMRSSSRPSSRRPSSRPSSPTAPRPSTSGGARCSSRTVRRRPTDRRPPTLRARLTRARAPCAATFMTVVAVEAAMLASSRAVVLGGWAQLNVDKLPKERADLIAYAKKNVHFATGSVPHGWLLPQCSAGVVHGGAGTVAAVVGAGIPCIVTPVLKCDQHFWGQRCNTLNVGVGFNKLLAQTSGADVAEALGKVDDTMREGARAKAKALKAEDGVGTGAALLGEMADNAKKAALLARRPSMEEWEDGTPPVC